MTTINGNRMQVRQCGLSDQRKESLASKQAGGDTFCVVERW